ncbi:MAG: phosphotransferase [Alphaproteobacteria bacterium]
MSDPRQRAASLPCWSAAVAPEPLSGGITNTNFLVEDGGRRFVVRIGADIPVHQIMRFNEQAASRAAHAAGLSPEVVYAEPGAMVLAFVDGRVLGPADFADRRTLRRAVDLMLRCHRDLPAFLRGPVLAFWVFHVVRDYAATLRETGSAYESMLPGMLKTAERLERLVGPIDMVFGHNDLLAANFIDDGERLWLIDWDYAGFNSPLFDLGGLAANNALPPALERWLLEAYFNRPVGDELMLRYQAMKCAALLRETLWSMVSEQVSTLTFDYAAYTTENLQRFKAALAVLDGIAR